MVKEIGADWQRAAGFRQLLCKEAVLVAVPALNVEAQGSKTALVRGGCQRNSLVAVCSFSLTFEAVRG